ncbi:MAG: formylglycine-generating enzyme family protein [Prosthecobacter sp.]|uniref:formylglycine-generating enzyme family protein n=1 Tax=Prosthecobacter sp. TaxID=1965333 RepID=UPI0025D8420D|nr:formylglycine-generating enzyme family protein [Prosthecobacter sp.]MCF7788328.1 formylglycine-generating enzyme family protein [Prosthecobacter sp.]
MSDSKQPKLELQVSSPQALVRRMDQQLELVGRLLAEADAAKAIVPASIINSLGMQMLWCPPGKFLMGSPEDEEGHDEDENQVQVQISQGFWMARTPVTQGQWQALMGSNPSVFGGGKDLPVEKVRWDDAQEFCTKLNVGQSDHPGYRYALPSEAQWEYSCRAGETGPYSGGSLDEVGWYDGNSGSKTHDVGQKKPNAWGLHDMHGNVSEWCADWHDFKLQGGVDPKGPESGVYRVDRGGSWFSYAAGCRAALRGRVVPYYRNRRLGVRPALVPSR